MKKKNLGKIGLQIDIIDLYQSNWMDENIAYKETLFAYEKLLKEGKIRAISASNPNLKQLSNSIRVVHKAVITNISNITI